LPVQDLLLLLLWPVLLYLLRKVKVCNEINICKEIREMDQSEDENRKTRQNTIGGENSDTDVCTLAECRERLREM